MQKVWVIVVIIAVLGALGVAVPMLMKKSAGNHPAPAQTTAVEKTPVSAEVVATRDIQEKVAVTGTLLPVGEVTVGSRYAGRVAWVIGKSGMRVSRGAVVARLEDMDARTQVRSAQALLAGASARAQQAQAAVIQQEAATSAGIRSAQAGVRAATARLEQTKAAVSQQSVATDSGIKGAEAAMHAAKARLEQAKAAAEQQVTATDSGIHSAQAALEAAKARLQQAQSTTDATEATATAQVKGAEATLDTAKSRQTLLKNGARPQERRQAENAVRLAKATYDNDVANYERYQKLYDDKAIAKALLENARTKMEVSKAQYESAQEQLSLVQTGARDEDIQAADAAVRQAQQGVEAARAGLKQIDVAKANVQIARTGVQQAQAALETANAATKVDVMRDKDVLAAQAALEQAQQGQETARASRQVNVMRDKDVLAAQAAVEQAQQGLETARANTQMNLMRAQDVLATQAAVEQAREQLTLALQTLDYTMIYSPVDGVVARQIAEVGQSLGAGEDILSISTNNSLFFEAEVSELEAPRLHAGQLVTLAVDAMQSGRNTLSGSKQAQTIAGSVEKVVPVVNQRTRSFTVRVIVPADKALFPGMFARGDSRRGGPHPQVTGRPEGCAGRSKAASPGGCIP